MKENRQEQMAPALRGNHPWKDFIPCKEASTLSMWQKPDWMTDTGRVNQIKTVWQQAHKNPQKQKLPSGWLSHYASAIRSRSQFWDRAPQWGSLPRRKPVSPSHTLRAYVPLSLFHSQINLKKIKQAKKKETLVATLSGPLSPQEPCAIILLQLNKSCFAAHHCLVYLFILRSGVTKNQGHQQKKILLQNTKTLITKLRLIYFWLLITEKLKDIWNCLRYTGRFKKAYASKYEIYS